MREVDFAATFTNHAGSGCPGRAIVSLVRPTHFLSLPPSLMMTQSITQECHGRMRDAGAREE